MTLRQRALAGIGWSFTSQILRQALQFAIGIALARLLAPEAFGLLAMVGVFTGFLAVLANMGLGPAIIQASDPTQEQISTVFWLSLGIGVVLMLVLWAGAPLVAAFYGAPEVSRIMRFLSVASPVHLTGIVPRALLSRRLNFRSQAIVEVVATLGSGATAIALAVTGFGVDALIAREFLLLVISSLGLWWAARWLPAWRFHIGGMKQMLSFGWNLTGFQAFNYWMRRADNLLLGKYVGSAGLGIYDRAYRLMLLPLNQITAALGRVMFPALSQMGEDTERVKRTFLRAIGVISLVSFPMMTGLFVVADEFVLGLLGPQWVEVIPVLRILIPVGMLQSISSTSGWLYQSQGRTDLMFRWGVATGIFTILAFVAGLPWGVTGVASAYAIRTVILFYPNLAISGGLVGMRFREAVRSLVPSLLVALGMAGIVSALKWLLHDKIDDILLLGVLTTFGILTYAALVHVAAIPAYRDVRSLGRGGVFKGGPRAR